MVWQDYVLMIGGIILGISIVPMIRAREKPPFLTSIPTSLILTVFIVCLATLRLYLASFSTACTAVLWWVLVFQRAFLKSKAGM